MTKKQQAFEEWAETWDVIFNLCEQGKLPFSSLLQHSLQYKREWNRGK